MDIREVKPANGQPTSGGAAPCLPAEATASVASAQTSRDSGSNDRFEQAIKIADLIIKSVSLVAIPFTIWLGAQQLIKNEELKRRDIIAAKEAPYDKEVATITLKTLVETLSVIGRVEMACDSETMSEQGKDVFKLGSYIGYELVRDMYSISRGPVWLIGDDEFLDKLKQLSDELVTWHEESHPDSREKILEYLKSKKNREKVRKLIFEIRKECRRLTEEIRRGNPVHENR